MIKMLFIEYNVLYNIIIYRSDTRVVYQYRPRIRHLLQIGIADTAVNFTVFLDTH